MNAGPREDHVCMSFLIASKYASLALKTDRQHSLYAPTGHLG